VELMDASASKKASKTPPLLSRSKRLHTLFQGPKRSGRARQRTFSMVEEMKRLEESAVVLGFPAATGQAGPEHRKRVRPIVFHLCRHGPRPLIRSEYYELCLIQLRNPKNVISPKFVHTA
jgi:hypothetical protein